MKNSPKSCLPTQNSTKTQVVLEHKTFDLIQLVDASQVSGILSCGMSKTATNAQIESKARLHDRIEFIVSGSARILLNKSSFLLEESDLITLDSNDEYSIQVDREKPLIRYSFDLWNLKDEIKSMFQQQNKISTKEKQWVREIMEQIIESSQKPKNSQFLCQTLMEYLMKRFNFELKTQYNGESCKTNTYNRIRNYIETNYLSIQRIEDVSINCHVSLAHIGRLFKKHSLEKPSQLLNRLKMEKAASMLNSGDYLIKEISNTIGFENPLYFSNRFKLHFGICPKHYVKNQLAVTQTEIRKAG